MRSNFVFRKSDLPPAELKGALAPKLVIAIDGPAASGKGTLARKMAERLGFAHLDTGSLYRAVAVLVLQAGGTPAQSADVDKALESIAKNLTPAFLSSPALRTEAASQGASTVAVMPHVRAALLDYQREFAKNPPSWARGVVLDGRDVGTVVCPDADIKLFVTASAEIRAKRRLEELKNSQISAIYDAVLADIKARDDRDTNRAIAPLKPAKDAYVLDSSALDAAGTLDQALNLVRAHLVKMSDKT